MLCIPTKNSTLHTMFNLRQQNNNTWKDVIPFPEQDDIQHDVMCAQFRSKLDMTEAYEQTRIKPDDVHKNHVLYNIWHFSELSNTDGRL